MAAAIVFGSASAVAQPPMPPAHAELTGFHQQWRAFLRPAMKEGVPDYSAAAMAAKAAALPEWRAQLNAIDSSGWAVVPANDKRLVEAEINGFDFFLRVLKPWARDPSFYANVFGEQSDVPAHEGPSAEPVIDLFAYKWPLSRADDAALARQLRMVPALLAQAKTNLANSQAHDLWAYGDSTFRTQSAVLGELRQGKLVMRTIDGQVPATMTGASAALLKAIDEAKAATDGFAAWIRAEAPRRVGPSGVGKDNYNWWAKNVALLPYDWDAQQVLLKRELDRSLASLRLEEARNRALPPLTEITDPTAYRANAEAKTRMFNDFVVKTGLVPDRPYYRAAMEAQTSSYTPPSARNFFSHGTALDPLPLLSHSTHFVELARIAHEPHPDPIRRATPVFNMYMDRSEGWATAMEELLMHLGLYDDNPRAREIVWIMLANRAARGLASLHVQANEMDLAEAGRFHAQWTPRGWSDPASPLVGFEQLLYLRQPGYGTSYIVGKAQLDDLLGAMSHAADQSGQPFDLGRAWQRITDAGIVPPSLIRAELVAQP